MLPVFAVPEKNLNKVKTFPIPNSLFCPNSSFQRQPWGATYQNSFTAQLGLTYQIPFRWDPPLSLFQFVLAYSFGDVTAQSSWLWWIEKIDVLWHTHEVNWIVHAMFNFRYKLMIPLFYEDHGKIHHCTSIQFFFLIICSLQWLNIVIPIYMQKSTD